MRKFTHQEVSEFFANEGYTVKSQYVDCKTKMNYICPVGHEGSSTFDNFKRGKRCYYCRKDEAAKMYAHSIDKVRQDFIEAGLTPLFDEYRNSRQKLRYICACGSASEITYSMMMRGRRCNVCGIKKRLDSLCQNGHIPISLQQRYIHSAISGKLNHKTGTAFLDIAFPAEKIYVEYDGSGHRLSVLKGELTQGEFDKKEVRRRYALYRRGWKEIRFVSKKDRLPSKKKIVELFNMGLGLLKDSSFCVFDFDKKSVSHSGGTFEFDFGELTRIRKS